MLPQDVQLMSIVSVVTLITITLLYKEFRLLVFDANYLAAQGFPVTLLDILLMFLVVLVVMIGLQAVGVVLMAALLITPAAGARFWSDDLKIMLLLAALFGAVSGVLGVFFSSLAPRIPTGPVMVLAATLLFALSAVFAPRRGLLARRMRQIQTGRRTAQEHLLRASLEWMELNPGAVRIPLDALAGPLGVPLSAVERTAAALSKKGDIHFTNRNAQLTAAGKDKALAILKSHRLWEYYLLHRMALKQDHVHRDADQIEHILSPDVIERLEKLLQEDGVDVENITSVHPVAG